jgi:hypothetical protein
MNGSQEETTIQELLRSLESNGRDMTGSKSRVREQMFAEFDRVVDEPAGAINDYFGQPPADDPAHVFELFEGTAVPDRRLTAGRILTMAASVLALVISAYLLTGGERSQTAAVDDLSADLPTAAGIDLSELHPGLILDADDDGITVKRVEPGLMVFELTGRRSPVDTNVDLTILAVDEWSPALLAESVPRVENPDSLGKWLAISGRDLSTHVPFAVTDDEAITESWRSVLADGTNTCPASTPCGEVATARGGGSVSLIAGLTNELTSVSFPDGPTLLVHVAYPGSSGLPDPVGADIMDSIRIE